MRQSIGGAGDARHKLDDSGADAETKVGHSLARASTGCCRPFARAWASAKPELARLLTCEPRIWKAGRPRTLLPLSRAPRTFPMDRRRRVECPNPDGLLTRQARVLPGVSARLAEDTAGTPYLVTSKEASWDRKSTRL